MAEATNLVRQHFPLARIILGGAYPSLAPEHAATYSGAHILVVGSVEELAGLPLNLSLYPTRPSFTYLSIGTNKRSSTELFDEILARANPANQQERSSQFAFVDHDVVNTYPEQFQKLFIERDGLGPSES